LDSCCLCILGPGCFFSPLYPSSVHSPLPSSPFHPPRSSSRPLHDVFALRFRPMPQPPLARRPLPGPASPNLAGSPQPTLAAPSTSSVGGSGGSCGANSSNEAALAPGNGSARPAMPSYAAEGTGEGGTTTEGTVRRYGVASGRSHLVDHPLEKDEFVSAQIEGAGREGQERGGHVGSNAPRVSCPGGLSPRMRGQHLQVLPSRLTLWFLPHSAQPERGNR